jgi:hypothetical protein
MSLPPPRPLLIERPPEASDHGLPLGNGMLGATIWGDGAPLRLSLDRGDLWDLRPVPEYAGPEYTWAKVVEAHHAGRHEHLAALLEQPYSRPGPTKLPAGRIELTLPAPATRFTLDRARALAAVDLGDGSRLEAFIAADRQHGRFRLSADAAIRLAAPPFGGPPPAWSPPAGFNVSKADVWELEYPAPLERAWESGAGFAQEGWGGFAFAVALAWRDGPSGREAAWLVETRTGDEPLPILLERAFSLAETAAAEPFDGALKSHAAWWADYWSRGRVQVPDPDIQEAHDGGVYLFGAAAREGAPPAPLQGPWTSDNGRLPPWKGDYHHDLNTQMTYWPAYAANQLAASRVFLEWLWDTREACRDWTRRFFEVDGLNVPMTADLLNRQIGGWRQYSHSLSSAPWLAHHFHLHWRYTGDRTFLAERAYPYLEEVCRYLDAVSAERDAQGLRKVALSASPEIHNNAPEAWFTTWTNYDLVLFRWCLSAAAEQAQALDLLAQAARWRGVLDELPQPAVAEDGTLLVAPGHPLAGSHRHFSHAMLLHPLGMLRPFEVAADARVANATLDQLQALGTDLWMGYSMGWHAALLSRAGRGAEAAASLRAYQQAFTFPNGFHTNGDWQGRGYGILRFGVFTLEGNSAAVAGLQEMLLQSRPGLIRVFPAVPADWREVRFDRLLADGGVEVAASLIADEVEVTLSRNEPIDVTVAVGGAASDVTLHVTAQGVTYRTRLGREEHSS